MKHIIIGTAGHVDHGKTSLIKALTGIDADRLKEEKKRGITIELGFSHIEFPNGYQAGIVDVPGHEAFIKNMLMGAGGIDLAMLIVAADEGFMPQTIEHLEILTLLGIKKGLVVITKTDLVEPDFVEMVKEDVVEHTKGTFLEGCPIVPVSSYTKENIDTLKDTICRLIDEVEDKNSHSPFRLPADRVFSIEGFGTVATGTLTDGRVSVGEEIMIYPEKLTARVRNLQVHSIDVETAYAGQRVAVNLANIKKNQLKKGSTLAFPNSVKCSMMLDVRLELLKDCQRVVKNNSTVHVHHGSSSAVAKVCLLDQDELKAGESCFAQLRLTSEMATREKDRFVIRFFSPLETIGGGVILNSDPKKHKRFDKELLSSLENTLNGSERHMVLGSIKKNSQFLLSKKDIYKDVSLTPEAVDSEIAGLLSEGEIIEYLPLFYVDLETLGGFKSKIEEMLQVYHKDNPLSFGIKKSELKQKIFPKADTNAFEGILALLENDGVIKRQNELVALYDFEVKFSPKHKHIMQVIMKSLEEGAYAPPSVDDVYKLFTPKEKDDCKMVFTALLNDGNIVMVAPKMVFSGEHYKKALDILYKHFEDNDEITLAQMRDYLQTSRKFALALLEYWDKIKLTKMEGEARVLLKK